MRTQKEVDEVVGLTKELETAQSNFKEKLSGYHPHTLALAVQKAKRIRDAEVNIIRSSFFIIGGKDMEVANL
ncbi:hypothetical protein PP939_gp086 [Rhizobium phage RL38J1]|uniref:Uncharacterized protein n=1 Tax=Rhizobium phage RL38J1 TaxID=2663232 RepID=A0A6B9J5N7_9CAUD|nr:hypothetical protein PP939_gp086 [Rhizobium phage RL38J1]QGZ14055.1 hypothetical protein RL38J1_086 [Rhizobium phage RL38J1]